MQYFFVTRTLVGQPVTITSATRLVHIHFSPIIPFFLMTAPTVPAPSTTTPTPLLTTPATTIGGALLSTTNNHPFTTSLLRPETGASKSDKTDTNVDYSKFLLMSFEICTLVAMVTYSVTGFKMRIF
jgi:hypothetical protein